MKLRGKDASVIGMFLFLAGVLVFGAGQVGSAEIRVGRLDMERVYRAYPGMQEFQAEVSRVRTEFQQAQGAGDQQKMMEIQRKFQAMQETFHEKFESDLLKAAKAVSENENLDMVVVDVIYHADSAETVDVSSAAIEEMNGAEPDPMPVMPAP